MIGLKIPEIHCFEWLPAKVTGNAPSILAGTNLGQILQINFPQKSLHRQGIFQPYQVEKRFTHVSIVHQQRQCNVISYNSVAKNLLAAGY